MFQHHDPQIVDLMSKLLVLNPNLRLTAQQALQDDFFKQFPSKPIISEYDQLRTKPLPKIDNLKIRQKYITFIFETFDYIFNQDLTEVYHAIYATINLCDRYFHIQNNITEKDIIGMISIMSNLFIYKLIYTLKLETFNYGLNDLYEVQVHILKEMNYKLYYPNPAIELSNYNLPRNQLIMALSKLRDIISSPQVFESCPIELAKLCLGGIL
jgi:serine/threonine protein kinase